MPDTLTIDGSIVGLLARLRQQLTDQNEDPEALQYVIDHTAEAITVLDVGVNPPTVVETISF